MQRSFETLLSCLQHNQPNWSVRIRQTTEVVWIFSNQKGIGLVWRFAKRFNRELGSSQERVLGQIFSYCEILGAEEGDFQLQATRGRSRIWCMGEVQATVEEVSRLQVVINGYHASLHYGTKTRYSDVTRCFCRRNNENQDSWRGTYPDWQHVPQKSSFEILLEKYVMDQSKQFQELKN